MIYNKPRMPVINETSETTSNASSPRKSSGILLFINSIQEELMQKKI